MRRFYVYMLLCADNTFYVGVTNDLERRVAQHEYGNDPESYTFSRRPLRLVHSSDFQSILDAIDWEKRLKNWSHSKKRALVRGDWKRIRKLAQCKNSTAAVPAPLDSARGDAAKPLDSARGDAVQGDTAPRGGAG